MEERLAGRLVQVGIRTINAHQAGQARKFGVEVITMRDLAASGMDLGAQLSLNGPLYISFDVDVLDPAFAPGVSHYEPGGMSVREVLSMIQGLRVPVIGADIVEYNPTRDHHSQTAMVCAKMLKEISAAMMRRGAPPARWP
jgi:arginase family enzyme